MAVDITNHLIPYTQVKRMLKQAWDQGYETGCSSQYGTATPSGKPYDPDPNPYRDN